MWPFRSSKEKRDENDEESEYTEEEYEEEYEYEVEVTDDEYEEEEKPTAGFKKKFDVTQNGSDTIEIEDQIKEDSENKNNFRKDEGFGENEKQDKLSENEETEDEPLGVEEVSQQDDEKSLSEGEYDPSSDDEDEDESEYEDDDSEEDEDDTDSEEDNIIYESQEIERKDSRDNEDENEETLTAVEEKHSLLALAAEHDRVDILQSILSSSTPEERAMLIDPPQVKNDQQEVMPPPLHVAISFGSTNATTCLLRMGANPATRPIHKKFQGRTAWELAFGTNNVEAKINDSNKKSWFSPKAEGAAIDMAPSKRQGILHAFTAEALRCIGGDEEQRLGQLLKSGMSVNMDMGGEKNLAEWCREMNAANCLRLFEESKDSEREEKREKYPSSFSVNEERKLPAKESAPPPPPVRRLSSEVGEEDFIQNRLEELDTLAIGLSTYLDNLAEEVSVCHGLLLMGNGASALASHVRSLNDQQDFLQHDLEERNSKWTSTEKELAHHMRRRNKTEEDLQWKDASFLLLENNGDSLSSSKRLRRMSSNNDPIQLKAQLSASENKIRKLRASIADMSEESETAMKEVERRGLTGGIKLVRKLRDEIRQLEFQISGAKSGEVLCRAKLQRLQDIVASNNVKQQDKSVQQNITVVANNALDEPPKQVPKQQEEVQPQSESKGQSSIWSSTVPVTTEKRYVEGSNDTAYGTPVKKAAETLLPVSSSQAAATESKIDTSKVVPEESVPAVALLSNGLHPQSGKETTTNSERVAIGQSNALMKYEKVHGYMSMDLWQILLRIIGLGKVAVRQNVENLKKQSTTVMIV